MEDWDFVVERMARTLATLRGESFDKAHHEGIIIAIVETAGEDGWGFMDVTPPDEGI